MNCPICGIENPARVSFCMSCETNLLVSPEPVSHFQNEAATSSGFVGRDREMGELKSALDDATSGRGRLVMLVGEPGIGKTRTAQELAAYAQTQDAQVLWGRCYEGEGAPPYWPWVQVLESYLERTGPEQLLADMSPGASDIGEMLPELRERLPHLESPRQYWSRNRPGFAYSTPLPPS